MIIQLPHPISTNKVWRHVARNGRVMNLVSKEARDWRRHAQLAAKSQGVKILHGPFKATLTIYPKRRNTLDLDNVCKLALDSMQGIAYDNDRDMQALIVNRGEIRKEGGLDMEIKGI